MNKKHPGLSFSQRMRVNAVVAFLKGQHTLEQFMKNAEVHQIDNLLVLEAIRCARTGDEPHPDFWKQLKDIYSAGLPPHLLPF